MIRTTLLALGLLLFAFRARADEGFGRLTVDQVSELIAKDDASIYDNNGKDRWARGHVPGARWLDYHSVKASDLPADLDRKLVFYCANEH